VDYEPCCKHDGGFTIPQYVPCEDDVEPEACNFLNESKFCWHKLAFDKCKKTCGCYRAKQPAGIEKKRGASGTFENGKLVGMGVSGKRTSAKFGNHVEGKINGKGVEITNR